MRKIKFLFLLLFLAVVVIVSLHFIAENKALITVHTVLGDFVDIAAGQVLMWVFILGTVIGAVLGFLPISGYMFKIRRLEKQLAKASAQRAELAANSEQQSASVPAKS